MHPIGLWFSTAAFLMLINALLHLLAFVPGGFSASAWQLMPVGPLYLALAYGLWRQWRWVLFVQLIIACLGAAAAFLLWPSSALPNTWMLAIIIIDVLVAILCLMIMLPRRRAR